MGVSYMCGFLGSRFIVFARFLECLYINTVIYYIVSFVFVVQGVKPKAFLKLGRQLTTEMHP